MADNNFIRHNLIQDYLDGKLSGAALTNFQQQLQDDASLEQEVNLIRKIQKAFTPDDEQIEAVRQTLKEVHEEQKQSKSIAKIHSLQSRWLALIAIILLLLVFFFLLPRSSDPAQLYAKYATHTSLALTKKSDQIDNTAFQLEQTFNQGQYEKALDLTTIYLSKVPNAYDVLLAQGICQLELDQYDTALKTFQQIKQSDLRTNKGYWYTALTYLKMKDIEKCKAELNYIISSKSYNYTKANELIKKL